MIQRLYTIKDQVAEEAGPIFHAKNDQVAFRNYANMAAEKNLPPEEFKLLCIGEYNTETAEITPITPTEIDPKISLVEEKQ